MTARPCSSGSDRRASAPPRFGLSGKLLLLTILFVMIAEVLIYVPSIANFRLNWLNDRLAAAHTAALVLDAAPSGMVPEEPRRAQILDSLGAQAVAMKMGKQRAPARGHRHAADDPSRHRHARLSWSAPIVDAFDTLLFAPTTTSCASSGRRRWAATSSRS